jgi:hypothetical protein
MRVVQTGVQFLTGFLLVLPFQPRFQELSVTIHVVYLATVASSVASTVLLIAPVGMHRLLFRQRKLRQLVSVAHRSTFAGLCLLGLALAGVTVIIFDTVAGHGAAAVAGTCVLVSYCPTFHQRPLYVNVQAIVDRSYSDHFLQSASDFAHGALAFDTVCYTVYGSPL